MAIGPSRGFITHRWKGYDEALLLYVMGLGSPTYPLPDESYPAWLSTYVWKKIYDYEFVYAGPLFVHQLSHIWIDFRGIQDAYMRERGLDYFENSRRATYVQREYAIRNPREFALYGKNCWGITASDGPGPATLKVDGVEREFFDYVARGAPHGPDDGTIAPWAAVASLPFAPEIVFPAIRCFIDQVKLERPDSYGFKATFNPTYPVESDNEYRMGVALELRPESGPHRADDREPPYRPDLAADAAVSIHRRWAAPGGVPRRMVMSADRSAGAPTCQHNGGMAGTRYVTYPSRHQKVDPTRGAQPVGQVRCWERARSGLASPSSTIGTDLTRDVEFIQLRVVIRRCHHGNLLGSPGAYSTPVKAGC